MKVYILLGCLGVALIMQFSCAQSEKSEVERELLDMEASDYFTDEINLRFLKAAANGNIEVLRKLVEQGVDVDVEGLRGMRPVFWAFLKRNLVGYRFLLEHGADPNRIVRANGSSASIMQLAAIEEVPRYLELALEHGGEPNAPDDNGDRTIIFESIMHSRFQNVQLLIDNGADLNRTDRSGSTPAMVAASINDYQTVYALLDAGADPTKKSNVGYSLIDMIKRYGRKGMKVGSEEYGWLLKVIDRLEIEVDLEA